MGKMDIRGVVEEWISSKYIAYNYQKSTKSFKMSTKAAESILSLTYF